MKLRDKATSKAEQRSQTDLLKAIDCRDLGRTRELLTHGASPNSTNEHGTPALNCALYGTLAAREGDENIATLLLESGADPHRPDTDSVTPIMLAARNGFTELVKRLIRKRVDTDERGKGGDLAGWTALSLAARGRHKAIVRILIDAGADVNLPARGGRNPLAAAAASGDYPMVRELIAAGARANNISLFSPVAAGRLDIVMALLNAGADVNVMDDPRGGNRVLGVAVQAGKKDIVEVLIRAGAKLDALSSGRTPLIFAVLNARADLVEILLRAGAKVDARDIYKCTAVMEASFRGQKEIVLHLLAAGANPRLRSEAGTAMDGARKAGHTEIIQILKTALSRRVDSRRSGVKGGNGR